VPVIISAFVSSEQRNVGAQDRESLIKDANFEQEFVSRKIQDVKILLESRKANEISSESFNAELKVILSDIAEQVDEDLTWRGEMYRNIAYTYDFLIDAGEIVSSSGDKSAKQVSDMNKIMIEIESCLEDLTDLTDERKKKDIYEGLNETEKQLKKIYKMLQNYKAGL
jgi:hypothetical protein